MTEIYSISSQSTFILSINSEFIFTSDTQNIKMRILFGQEFFLCIFRTLKLNIIIHLSIFMKFRG